MASQTLRVITGSPPAGSEIPIGDDVMLGRAAEGAGALGQDPELSREHARITRDINGQLVLSDLGSTNGTYLNGWRIPAPQVLNPGDNVQLGTTVLELRAPDDGTQVNRRPAIVTGIRGAEALRPPPRTSVLYVTGVKKSYGDHAVLKGIDLEVQPGEIVGLLGPNGAGKTTLVSIIAGIRGADAGSVEVAGIDVLQNPGEARRFLGLAPQDLGIYPTLSVYRNLRFFGELAGLSGAELTARVQEVGDALSLSPIFEQSAGRLSGGQKRRLHTGMAMLHRPPLLILDEPTVGADIRTRQEILDLVKRLAAEGRAVCYSTHYLPEIEELGASVAMLEGGQIIARGSIAELIAKYSTSGVELRFNGPAPEVRFDGEVTLEDSILRVESEAPDEAAAALLARLGPHAARLAAVEIIRPSLDSVYLALTQHRYKDVQPLPPAERLLGSRAPGEVPPAVAQARSVRS
jgi:ABC-2 type transport system ATP-binding protein